MYRLLFALAILSLSSQPAKAQPLNVCLNPATFIRPALHAQSVASCFTVMGVNS